MAENPLQKRELLVQYLQGSYLERDMGASRLTGSFVFWKKSMPKNLSRYYQAWELRQQGKKLIEIGIIMKICVSRVSQLIHFIEYKIKYKKPMSNELKELINKYFETSMDIR